MASYESGGEIMSCSSGDQSTDLLVYENCFSEVVENTFAK